MITLKVNGRERSVDVSPDTPLLWVLRERAKPTDEDISIGMAGNICRCGTYQRIRRAIHLAAQLKAQGGAK